MAREKTRKRAGKGNKREKREARVNEENSDRPEGRVSVKLALIIPL